MIESLISYQGVRRKEKEPIILILEPAILHARQVICIYAIKTAIAIANL
jgi:hypothetical protein